MDSVNTTLSALRANPYASAAVNLFLVLYAGLAAPSLPSGIASLFENSLFKLAILVAVIVLVQGKNLTTGILVAVGFVLSMGTLSRYRISTLASEMVNLTGTGSGKPSDIEQKEAMTTRYDGSVPPVNRTWPPSFGPDGQRQMVPANRASWASAKGVNKVRIRGYEYSDHDSVNHLPGGHGSMNSNRRSVVSAPLHPDKKFSGPQSVKGYRGSSLATIGAPDSQL
jgi:hypothetical protein